MKLGTFNFLLVRDQNGNDSIWFDYQKHDRWPEKVSMTAHLLEVANQDVLWKDDNGVHVRVANGSADYDVIETVNIDSYDDVIVCKLRTGELVPA